MTKPLPTTGMISVYSGRECLGHVLTRGKSGFQAFDTEAAKRGAT
jgi:hypothetical protein